MARTRNTSNDGQGPDPPVETMTRGRGRGRARFRARVATPVIEPHVDLGAEDSRAIILAPVAPPPARPARGMGRTFRGGDLPGIPPNRDIDFCIAPNPLLFYHIFRYVIEGSSTFIDLMAQLASTQNMKQWAIGPILPIKLLPYNKKNEYCLEWLNKQPPKSVLYVSFGTTTSFSDEQIKELAMGLELSKQNFIWVLRYTDEVDNTGKFKKLKLPEGFEERAKGVGLVVLEWAPQPEILAHPSTGGFLSHCGWN
uniref:Zeatin O-xylosyltransferase-like n=1 Tax=Nicotiana tabacum TaxID=4097 RepID=A0A1S3X0L8_TOBAC|nr:PREDICTED: zeatin O-xylosyltransferase-like [Nicotiana tabacum]